MKPRNAKIDSFNFSSTNLEDLFRSEDYIIEPIKGVGVWKPKRWLETFKKSLTINIVEAKILHTNTGLNIAIKRFSASQDRQTLELAGLHNYGDKSIQLLRLLKELWEHIQGMFITRLDVAIDFKGNIPKSVLKRLKKHRNSFQWINTTYLKTTKEKKSNPKINILYYPKHIKEGFDDEIERLEFSFRGGYFNKLKVSDMDKAYKKMKKSIKRFTGLDVNIQSLKDTL